jgi:hypothetical protein
LNIKKLDIHRDSMSIICQVKEQWQTKMRNLGYMKNICPN